MKIGFAGDILFGVHWQWNFLMCFLDWNLDSSKNQGSKLIFLFRFIFKLIHLYNKRLELLWFGRRRRFRVTKQFPFGDILMWYGSKFFASHWRTESHCDALFLSSRFQILVETFWYFGSNNTPFFQQNNCFLGSGFYFKKLNFSRWVNQLVIAWKFSKFWKKFWPSIKGENLFRKLFTKFGRNLIFWYFCAFHEHCFPFCEFLVGWKKLITKIFRPEKVVLWCPYEGFLKTAIGIATLRRCNSCSQKYWIKSLHQGFNWKPLKNRGVLDWKERDLNLVWVFL